MRQKALAGTKTFNSAKSSRDDGRKSEKGTARGSVVLVTGTAWGRLVLTDLDGGALMGGLDACRHSRFRQVTSCVVAGIQVVEVAGAAYLGVALGAPFPNASSTPGAANGTLTGQLPPVEDLLVFRLDAATANVTLTGLLAPPVAMPCDTMPRVTT
ncbi:hypothetical protein PAPYR_9282 [Paratrimastix pyriformis]|uniref:Uncharacterized protein n=1 Tax=Paratrimastix pyriformis TaxID=342808 RepID=A0ABQ8UBD4_9EUKA|nr:hypothetical protein PAPYR_9282 [Paratrimastix pyriformis]